MQRRNLRINPRHIAGARNPRRWTAMRANTDPDSALLRATPLPADLTPSSQQTAEDALEFGHCRVLLRQRQLLADGVPVELGTRAFDLLLALLEANGSLLSKEELLSRVWPGIVVSEENLKVQVSALRKALGRDRDVIHTEFGRGYRFTGVLCANGVEEGCRRATRARPRFAPTLPGPAGQAEITAKRSHSCWRWRSLRCSFS